MRARIAIVSMVLVPALLTMAPGVEATAPSCTYTADQSAVRVILDRHESARLYVAAQGEIKVDIDSMDLDCGDATTANTTAVLVEGNTLGNLFVITQNGVGGAFPPTINFVIAGMEGSDSLTLIGTTGNDSFRFGQDQDLPRASLFGSGSQRIETDVDAWSARMLAGDDVVTGKPAETIFDGRSPLPLEIEGNLGPDRLIGSPNADAIDGGAADDALKGLGGPDTLFGRAGDDGLNGGPGVDDCNGGPGDDRLRGCEN